jgi:UDP-3-O-[3-hydroxymyristoyl] glucosamine N-acyltransferase
MDLPLSELAVRFGCELRGDPGLRIGRVATLGAAGPGDLSFLANPQYRPQLAATRATAVVIDAASAQLSPVAVLVHSNPYATYARMAALLHPEPAVVPGVHATAFIDPSAQIAPSASVGALVFIGPRAVVGERAVIGAGCVLGADVRIGADCLLQPRVTLVAASELGERTRLHSGVVIGSDGFGFARDAAGWTKVPQIGRVRVGADVEVGANTTIDRGAIEDTVIEDGVKLDNQIQIAHNVQIGAHTVIAACTGVSGSTRIGARCVIAGAVGIAGHLTICDDVVVTGMSSITHSLTAPGVYSGCIPVTLAPVWRRLVGRFKRLDTLNERVRRLERGENGSQQQDQD